MGKKVKSKYRVKENMTLNEEVYHTIEKCRKKYFLFGPYVWVPIIDFGYKTHVGYKHKSLKEAQIVCDQYVRWNS